MDGLITVSFLQPFPEMLSSSASRFTAGLQGATESQIEKAPFVGSCERGLQPGRIWCRHAIGASLSIRRASTS